MTKPATPSGSWEAVLTGQATRYSRFYFGLAYRILRDAPAAEDACQQAFLKAWEHQDRIQHKDGLSSWLTQTVINESLQVLRRRKTERGKLANVSHNVLQNIDPAKQVEQRDSVQVALLDVPQPTRSVVVLRLMHGLSGNEVKDVLECSASEVSRRLHDGMEQLRRILAQQ